MFVGGRLCDYDVGRRLQTQALLNHETNKFVMECVSPAK